MSTFTIVKMILWGLLHIWRVDVRLRVHRRVILSVMISTGETGFRDVQAVISVSFVSITVGLMMGAMTIFARTS